MVRTTFQTKMFFYEGLKSRFTVLGYIEDFQQTLEKDHSGNQEPCCFFILNVNTLFLFFCHQVSSSVSQPIALYNVFKLIERVTPETILAASICICYSLSFLFAYNYHKQQMCIQVLTLGMICIFDSLFCNELNI